MRISTGLFGLLTALAFSSTSFAIDPAGSAVGVNPQATGALQGNSAKTLVVGDDVFLGQTIQTGDAGQVQIVFSDATHLVVGPGATLVIAEYLMRNEATASKMVINALGGTFRFITGNSPKSAYEINTPTGTMGVRGTAFEFTVTETETSALLYHGAVILCGVDKCEVLSDRCDVGLVSTGQETSVLRHSDRRRIPYIPGFPYLVSQDSLLEDFQLDGTRDCRRVRVPSIQSSVVGPRGYVPPAPEPVPPECECEGECEYDE